MYVLKCIDAFVLFELARTSSAKARKEKAGFDAALKRLRHPKAGLNQS
jgi:hypothetical protein